MVDKRTKNESHNPGPGPALPPRDLHVRKYPGGTATRLEAPPESARKGQALPNGHASTALDTRWERGVPPPEERLTRPLEAGGLKAGPGSPSMMSSTLCGYPMSQRPSARDRTLSPDSATRNGGDASTSTEGAGGTREVSVVSQVLVNSSGPPRPLVRGVVDAKPPPPPPAARHQGQSHTVQGAAPEAERLELFVTPARSGNSGYGQPTLPAFSAQAVMASAPKRADQPPPPPSAPAARLPGGVGGVARVRPRVDYAEMETLVGASGRVAPATSPPPVQLPAQGPVEGRPRPQTAVHWAVHPQAAAPQAAAPAPASVPQAPDAAGAGPAQRLRESDDTPLMVSMSQELEDLFDGRTAAGEMGNGSLPPPLPAQRVSFGVEPSTAPSSASSIWVDPSLSDEAEAYARSEFSARELPQPRATGPAAEAGVEPYSGEREPSHEQHTPAPAPAGLGEDDEAGPPSTALALREPTGPVLRVARRDPGSAWGEQETVMIPDGQWPTPRRSVRRWLRDHWGALMISCVGVGLVSAVVFVNQLMQEQDRAARRAVQPVGLDPQAPVAPLAVEPTAAAAMPASGSDVSAENQVIRVPIAESGFQSDSTMIISVPSGAEVIHDGTRVGTTPMLMSEEFATGLYLLRKPGYQPQLLRIDPRKPTALTVRLQAMVSGNR